MSVLHRRTSGTTRPAGPMEETAARLWNVLNEGKPFTLVFGLGLLLVTGAPAVGLLAVAPLAFAWWRHPWPLHLRVGLWVLAGAIIAVAGGLPAGPAALALGLFLTFTIVLWGTVYYHLRIDAPLTNFWRFWRLVLENPDPTSGNFLEQVPKVAALLAVGHSARPVALSWLCGIAAWGIGALVHRHLVTWVPTWATGERAHDRRPVEPGPARCGPPSRKVLLVVIDGCRVDRLAEADTPFLDRLAREGISYDHCSTVYPARTVTGFSSMLTGAPPVVHGLRSNFVPRPDRGVRCESVFDVIPDVRMVGIAHLVDAFGSKVSTVTAVMPNDEIDAALCRKAREVVEADDPDVLVVQTLSVDQTGHFRGSFYDEYLAHIESTDRELEALVGWLAERWGGLDGVTIGVLSDHGQGRGIGGHGHWTPTERLVPCIWWGQGVPDAPVRPRVSVMDVTATLCHRAGVRAPGAFGRTLPPVRRRGPRRGGAGDRAGGRRVTGARRGRHGRGRDRAGAGDGRGPARRDGRGRRRLHRRQRGTGAGCGGQGGSPRAEPGAGCGHPHRAGRSRAARRRRGRLPRCRRRVRPAAARRDGRPDPRRRGGLRDRQSLRRGPSSRCSRTAGSATAS